MWPYSRWAVTAEIDLREIECDDVDCIRVVQSTGEALFLVNTNTTSESVGFWTCPLSQILNEHKTTFRKLDP
jgi:hypothetical protein